MARFQLVQTHQEFTDYDTEQSDPVLRLTLVNTGTERYAYLTMRDYSEKTILWEEAQRMLTE